MKVVATLEDAQGFKQVGELGLAFVLSSLTEFEREWRQTDVLEPGTTAFHPSRVAAQIVSGIGFIGGGLIFVRGDRCVA